MNSYTKHIAVKGLLVISILLSACKKYEVFPDKQPIVPTQGKADFSKYVAVGGTETSGFADGALFTSAQEVSYPALIAKSIRTLVPNLQFVQPDIGTERGFSKVTSGAPFGKNLLFPSNCLAQNFRTVAITGDPITPYAGDKTQITNFGVPYLLTNQALVPLTSATNAGTNPALHYNRFASASGTSVLISDAKNAQGTFFTLWIGTNDILKAALAGDATSFTSVASFATDFNKILDSLLAASPNAKGAVATIPYVTDIPFFTNVNRKFASSSDPLRSPFYLDATKAALYNDTIVKQGFANPGYTAGFKNNYLITTSTGTVRQLDQKQDFVLNSYKADSLIGVGPIKVNCSPNNRLGFGLYKPIPANQVLDKDEIATIKSTVDAYNAAIKAAVDARNAAGKKVALVDVNKFYYDLTYLNPTVFPSAEGPTTHLNVTVKATTSNGALFGGFYSTDLLWPTPKGNVFLANEFIESINKNFGSTLPKIDPNNYRGNVFP